MFRSMFCALVLLLAAPAVADQAKIKLSPAVWADFQAYLQGISSTRQGAYAVVEDGQGGIGYYCPGQRCKQTLFRKGAIDNCERINPGYKCIIFAEDRDIQVEYEVGE